MSDLRINLSAEEQRQLSAVAADLGITPRELATRQVRKAISSASQRPKSSKVGAKTRTTKKTTANAKKGTPDIARLLNVFKKYAVKTKGRIDDSRESIYGDDR